MLESGKYYVGDLCYVIQDDTMWKSVCAFLEQSSHEGGEFELGGVTLAIYGTEYGDGVYYDQQYRAYGVDSGTIGIAPMSWLESIGAVEEAERTVAQRLGAIVDFADDFYTDRDVEGVISFGNISIDTNPSDDDDDYGYDDYEDDEDDEDD